MTDIKLFPEDILEVTDTNFNELALRIFNYQYKNNSIYNDYCKHLKVAPEDILSYREIPCLPVDLFKYHKIKTGNFIAEKVFLSSGTTGMERSQHEIHSLSWYHKVAKATFESFYNKISDYIFLAILPNYQENPSSSLISMINYFMEESGSIASGYTSLKTFERDLEKARKENKKVMIWGVSFALLDLAEKNPVDLSDCILMETGGMKGQRTEITREELHKTLKDRLKSNNIHSEYGMTELLTQAYSKSSGNFLLPAWAKVLIREIHDPFSISDERAGIIRVMDLSNYHTCSFIETADLGRKSDIYFQVLGRSDNSDLRGCNLLYTD